MPGRVGRQREVAGWTRPGRASLAKPRSAAGRERERPPPPPAQAMRTAILLNCGAAEDVRALLELESRPNVRVIIVDSHRPICHTANVDEVGGG